MITNGAPYNHNYGRTTQNGFGGINAKVGADSGEVLSLIDMTSDDYPILSTRPSRWLGDAYTGTVLASEVVDGATAIVKKENINGADRYRFVYGQEECWLPSITEERARIVNVGDYILLFPFYMYYDLRANRATQMTGTEFRAAMDDNGNMSKTVTINGEEHTFKEGELFYVTEDAEPSGTLNHVEGLYKYNTGSAELLGEKINSVYNKVILDCSFTDSSITLNYKTTAEINLYRNYFRAGDAVKIEGCLTEEANNKTAIIREVSGNTLKFYEGTFTLPSGQGTYTEKSVTIARDIPEMDIVFVHHNRVWGAKGRNIYCSKQGDALVWSDYDSLADGSWWADTGTEDTDGITGGCAYTYPRFFSGDHIYTVYGDTPADFSINEVEAKGAAKGESESFAVVGGTLFYLSRCGFMAYTGGYPQKIDAELGPMRLKKALAAANEYKYYVQCWEWDGKTLGTRHVFVYDTTKGLWHEETTSAEIEGFMYAGDLTALYDGREYSMGRTYKVPCVGGIYEQEEPFVGKVVFNDYTMDAVSKKQAKEIIIRHEVGAYLTVKVYVDDVLDPSFTRTIPPGGKKTTRISGIPKRCDHWRLELSGEAPWKVWSIAYEYYEGNTK